MTIYPIKGWSLVIVVGSFLAVVCTILDSFHKKHEVKALHSKLRRFAEILRETPLTKWQIRIAEFGISFLRWLHEVPSKVLNTATRILENTSLGNIIFWIGAITIPLLVLVLYIAFDWWILGSVMLPFLLIIFFYIISFVVGIHEGMTDSNSKLDDLMPKILIFLFSLTSISMIMSLLSVLISIFGISVSILDCHWFEIVNSAIRPAYPFLLPIINFPFDLATIIVTIFLLLYVIKKKQFIMLVAILDVILSAFFSVLLYTCLKIVENGWDILGFGWYFLESLDWFKNIGIYFLEFLLNKAHTVDIASMRDIHLLPILLTTFVPVALYMSVFVFLSFCKGVLKLACRLFEAVGSKEESVFKQLGFLIAIIMAAIKAIYDYFNIS